MTLSVSSIQAEGAYQASQWQITPVLLSHNEMAQLFRNLPLFEMYQVSQVLHENEEILSKEMFLHLYGEYLISLQQDTVQELARYRAPFSNAWSTDATALYIHPLEGTKRLVKVKLPVLQLQPHSFGYSQLDREIRSKTFGMDSIPWGIQFSYPSLYQDPQSGDIVRVNQEMRFANVAFFRAFRKWIREITVPTQFAIEGTLLQTSIRTGKECFAWLHQHAELNKRGWRVCVPKSTYTEVTSKIEPCSKP